MDFTLQKTFTFILFIGIGLLLKLKFEGKNEISGIKKIILNLALPATIFIALLGIKIDAGLLLLPIMALALNAILFFGFPLLLPIVGIEKNTPKYRTVKMLIPSLAPGLSCFPFIMEFLGDGYLAKAAMADLGNKVFVLMILYLVAMNWHYKLQSQVIRTQASKLKSLFVAMVAEPVNLFIAVALLLLAFGINMDSLPFVISDTLLRLSTLMTPLVLLFIGLAVKIRRKQFAQILSVLLL
ncbi:MAG: permease, partial [Leeuwenhoekiella sp.]